jgi:hypothetical protein
MALATNDNAIPPIPSLPPLVGIDGRRYEDVVPQIFPGQNSPPVAVALSKNTPPPFHINAGCCSDQPSTMSSLTATNNVSTPAASRTQGRDNSGSSGQRRQCLGRWRQRDSATSAVQKPARRRRKLGGGTAAAAASAAVAAARSAVAVHSAKAAARLQQRGCCGGGGSNTAQRRRQLGGGSSANRGGGAQHNGGSAVAARWQQQGGCGGGGSVTGSTPAPRGRGRGAAPPAVGRAQG